MLFYVRDRQNPAPKNTVAVVNKETPRESVATNRASLNIFSSRNDQVNGSGVMKASSLKAPVANSIAPLRSCDKGSPAVLTQKDLNAKDTQKDAPSIVEAKGILKRENDTEPLESCDKGAPAVLAQKDLNAKETQKELSSSVEANGILKRENGSAPLKPCDLRAPAVSTQKVLCTKETLQKEVPLPQANGEVSLVKYGSKAACTVLLGKDSLLLEGSTNTQILVNLPASAAKDGNNLKEAANSLKVSVQLITYLHESASCFVWPPFLLMGLSVSNLHLAMLSRLEMYRLVILLLKKLFMLIRLWDVSWRVRPLPLSQ